MKNTMPVTVADGNSLPGTILKTIVDQSVKTSLLMARRNGSEIVNDVPGNLDIHADQFSLGKIIKGLLYAVVSNAKDSCIRITAKETYGNMIALSVKDDNSCHTYAVACNLQEMVPLAAEIGGDINIANERHNIITISLRFPAAKKEMNSVAA